MLLKSFKSAKINTLYDLLLKKYGPQGWWPVHPAFNSSALVYHPGDYSLPQGDHQKLEISIGAILTQNTSWSNVTLALHRLEQVGLFTQDGLQEVDLSILADLIRPAGYFNQKSRYLKNWIAFLAQHPFGELESLELAQARTLMLSVIGIGEETADSILLYALRHPSFVIDAYTRRLVANLGWIEGKEPYGVLRHAFMEAFPPDLAAYQEFHALFVAHGKNFYSKKPYGQGDPLLKALA